MVKVSVIVPTYNRANMVTKTIDSILNQSFSDFELIIVDNESDDNTETVIKSYTDERIRYYKHQNNGVVAVNRNYGIRLSQGEYIAFCDDDDLWLPEKLAKQIQEFEKDKVIGLVCTNAIVYDENGEHGKRIRGATAKDFTFNSLLWGNRIICSSVCVKKEVLDDIGLMDENPAIFSGEDYELWLRIASKYSIRYIDIPLIQFYFLKSVTNSFLGENRDSRKTSEIIERNKVIYKGLLEKGILEEDLYQRRINDYDSFLSKLQKRAWVRKVVTPLVHRLPILKELLRRSP